MQPSAWSDETMVHVLPFTRAEDGEDVIIGRPETGTFLSVSPDALYLVDRLAEGSTFAQSKAAYRDRYGMDVDAEEFLELLEGKGFLTRGTPPDPAPVSEDQAGPSASAPKWRISRELAVRLTSWPVLGTMLAVASSAAVLCFLDPAIIPGPRDAYFPEHSSLKLLAVMLIIYASTFCHEMGHLIAGRASGLPARIGIGHRMWVLVLETDLTGLWAFPKRRRYLPILAGGLIDLTFVGFLLGAGYAERHGLIELDGNVLGMLRALTYLMLMRILWQFFLFVRTDVYFLIAMALGCRNLMADTEAFLRNRVSRVIPWVRRTDQRAIPLRERRIIGSYAAVWLIGRALALYALFFLTLPILLLYLRQARTNLVAGFSGQPYLLFDGLVITLIYVLPMTLGLALWMRSLLKSWKGRLWKSRPWLVRRRDGIEAP